MAATSARRRTTCGRCSSCIDSAADATTLAERLALEFNPEALRRAVADLTASYPDDYRRARRFRAETGGLREATAGRCCEALGEGDAGADPSRPWPTAEELFAFSASALLANPLLDFDELLVLKRKTPDASRSDTYWQWGQQYGMTVNWSCDFRPKNPPVAPWWDEADRGLLAVREARAPLADDLQGRSRPT